MSDTVATPAPEDFSGEDRYRRKTRLSQHIEVTEPELLRGESHPEKNQHMVRLVVRGIGRLTADRAIIKLANICVFGSVECKQAGPNIFEFSGLVESAVGVDAKIPMAFTLAPYNLADLMIQDQY